MQNSVKSTMFDYITWRSDLTLEQDPFNEIDNLFLASIVFMNFSGIVPDKDSKARISLKEAVETFNHLPKEKQHIGVLVPDEIIDLANQAKDTRRFSDWMMSDFVDILDERREMQFSAMVVHLPDGSMFVAFRGTDDTILGWKEDLNMSFSEPVPAQETATAYLKEMCEKYDENIRIGGHSKGGNLSIWSALHSGAEVWDRILNVYSNDGPGFSHAVLDLPAYEALKDKIRTFIPQSSIVGMVFHNGHRFETISSGKLGIMQHDPLSWHLIQNHFDYQEERSKFGEESDKIFSDFLNSLDTEDRKKFVNMVYEVLTASGAKTLTEIEKNKIKSITAMHRVIKTFNPEEQNLIKEMIGRLFIHKKEEIPE